MLDGMSPNLKKYNDMQEKNMKKITVMYLVYYTVK